MSGRNFRRGIILAIPLFLFFINIVNARGTEDLDVSSCTPETGSTCDVGNCNDNSTSTVGATIEKTDWTKFDWTNVNDSSSNYEIDEVEFHLYHGGESGITNSWTVDWKNEAETSTYCTDTTSHSADPLYVTANTTVSCSWTTAKLNDLRIILTSGDGAGPSDAYVYYIDMFVYVKDNSPWHSSEADNSSGSVFHDDVINHSVIWTDDINTVLSHYKFSTNTSGSWVNSSVSTFTNSWIQTSSNVSSIGSSCAGNVVGWRFFANDSNNNWNSSDIQTYDCYKYGTLQVIWTSGSQINSTTCTSESSCDWIQYATKFANATVTCVGGSGAKCGIVSGSILYNGTLINTTESATPMYLVGGSGSGIYSWGVVEEHGDGGVVDSPGHGAYIGDYEFYNTGDYFNSSVIWFRPDKQINVTQIIVNIDSTDFISDYGVLVDVYICEGDGTYDNKTSCQLVKNDWDPVYEYGKQTINLDTPILVSDYVDYIVDFRSSGSNNNDENDRIMIANDDSATLPRTSYCLSIWGCSNSNDYGNITINGSAITITIENPTTSFATLNNGDSYLLNYTINATQSGTANLYNLSMNFSSSYPSVSANETAGAYMCIGGSCGGEIGESAEFTITIPSTGCTSSAGNTSTGPLACDATATCRCNICYFNSTDLAGNSKNISCQGQNTTFPFLQFINSGSSAEKWQMKVNQSLPSSVKLWGTLNGTWSYDIKPINSSLFAVINASIPDSATEDFWLWTNFTSFDYNDRVTLATNSSSDNV